MPEPSPNPETPLEAPGTPNSATTSLSTLSTTAIKDGHRGGSYALPCYGHHNRTSSHTLEAERADRISRLAGLERISATRLGPNHAQIGAGSGFHHISGQIPSYFDLLGNPVYAAKISTVGSVSATESLTGQANTWASGSVREDEDFMSVGTMDDRDKYSVYALDEDIERDADGLSDTQSLVGFGEGAGSTVSGPIYVRSRAVIGQTQSGPATPMSGDVEKHRKEAKTIDSLADENPGNGHPDSTRPGEKFK